MRKWLLVTLLSTGLLITGCQDMQGASNASRGHQTIYNQTGGSQQISQNERLAKQNDARADFGYVRHQKAQVEQLGQDLEAAYLDRQLVADLISKMAVHLPDVEDCGTLVTDKYILVSYEGNSDDPRYTAEQIRLTAESIVPRYYDVYVSDKPVMMDNIERFGSLSTLTPNVDEEIEDTIREMLGTNEHIADPDRRERGGNQAPMPSIPNNEDQTPQPTI